VSQMNEKEIVSKILRAAEEAFQFIPTTKVDVETGEVRVLSHLDKGRGGQLVVITKTDSWSATAQVILINNLVDVATTRDFISGHNNKDFEAAIWTDFHGTVDFTQLQDSPVISKICSICISKLEPEKLESIGFNVDAFGPHTCLRAGMYNPLINEEIWEMRNYEYELFFDKLLFLSPLQIAARQAQRDAFLNSRDQLQLIRESSNAQKTIEAIDSLDDLTLSLVRI
jgi:hypothetical protein